jgi:hypothetical protein
VFSPYLHICSNLFDIPSDALAAVTSKPSQHADKGPTQPQQQRQQNQQQQSEYQKRRTIPSEQLVGQERRFAQTLEEKWSFQASFQSVDVRVLTLR